LNADGGARGDAVHMKLGENGIGSYAIAYDTRRKSLLLVYSLYDSRTDTSGDIMSQRLNVAGHLIGAPRQVTDVAARGLRPSAQALRYASAGRRFLLVWTSREGPDQAVAYTRRLDSDGSAQGTDTAVFTGDNRFCALSDRQLAGQFLLACDSSREVRARRVTPAGVPRGGAFVAWHPGPDASTKGAAKIEIATSARRGRWAVMSVGARQVHLRTLDARGHGRGRRTFGGQPVDDAPGSEGTPVNPDLDGATIAYSPKTATFLVAWSATYPDRTSDQGGYTDTWAQLADSSAVRTLGPRVRLSQSGLTSGEMAARADGGKRYLLLRDDSDGGPYPSPYLHSLYSQHLLTHR
jgi:hypothetical protein